MPHLDFLTDEGRSVGACNTVFIREDENGNRLLCGTNTDTVGVRDAFYNNLTTDWEDAFFHGRPGLVLGGFAILAPPLCVHVYEMATGAESQGLEGEDAVRRINMYRRAYPMLLSLGLLVKYFITLRRGYKALKVKIRDDAYLMGERLQNYDGSQSGPRNGKSVPVRRA